MAWCTGANADELEEQIGSYGGVGAVLDFFRRSSTPSDIVDTAASALFNLSFLRMLLLLILLLHREQESTNK
jgi:hypothetical protein